jgi:restriction system protein
MTSSERGAEELEKGHSRLTVRYLTRFEEYRVFRGLEQKQNDEIPSDASEDDREEQTPTDRLESAFQEAQDPLRAEVLEAVLKQDDKFFEQLVLDVLTAAGYGGRVEDEPSLHLGRTADGGVDGMIKEDPLGLDLIYVQAKRYKVGQNLDVKEIRAFSGSLDEFGSKKGVFVTTSDFTRPAREYAQKIGDKKIALINGRGLVDLMMKHQVGVRVEQVYELKAVDMDYFEP